MNGALESVDCSQCGGFAYYMGSLGAIDYYRCRNCGTEGGRRGSTPPAEHHRRVAARKKGAVRKNPGKCTWCGSMQLRKHPDASKARDGLKYCSGCGMTHSPHATIKGSFAYLDTKTGKIVTGIRRK
jgi:hypothetical protein